MYRNARNTSAEAPDRTYVCAKCGEGIRVPFNDPVGPRRCPYCLGEWYKYTKYGDYYVLGEEKTENANGDSEAGAE